MTFSNIEKYRVTLFNDTGVETQILTVLTTYISFNEYAALVDHNIKIMRQNLTSVMSPKYSDN